MLEGRNKVPKVHINMDGFTGVPLTLKQKMLSGEDKPSQCCYQNYSDRPQMSQDQDMKIFLIIKNPKVFENNFIF